MSMIVEQKFDKNNNRIYSKNSNGFEIWVKYDENNNKIYYKNSFGNEYWYKYDENNDCIEITEKEYKEKEYNSRTKCSRFELMEI